MSHEKRSNTKVDTSGYIPKVPAISIGRFVNIIGSHGLTSTFFCRQRKVIIIAGIGRSSSLNTELKSVLARGGPATWLKGYIRILSKERKYFDLIVNPP